jgi:hypothetical protein
MCNYCVSATDRCCADDQPPVLIPVEDRYVCREVEEISLKAVALAFFLLVVIAPMLQYWLDQENRKFARSLFTPAQYEIWEADFHRRMNSN